MRVAVFRVWALPPNVNYLHQVANKRAWHRETQAAHQAMAAAILEARQFRATGWDGRCFPRARLCYTFHFPDARPRDPENQLTKPFTDMLVEQGVLTDDSFDHVTLVLQRGSNARPPWTEIRVEEG